MLFLYRAIILFELLPPRRLVVGLNGTFGDIKCAAGKVGTKESPHRFEVIRIVFEFEVWRLGISDDEGPQAFAAGK